MASANSKSILLLLIVAASCLMMISAEEQVPSVDEVTTGNRQSKQLMLMQLSPSAASTYPLSYLSGSSYELPLMMPQQSSLIRRYPVRKQQQLASSSWPYHSPLLSSPELKNDRDEVEEDEETPAAWRVHDGIEDFGHLKWWKRRFNRQAVITIHPASTECLTANIGADGLGPCKRATQAPHGTIHITFPATGQTAVIAITANSPVNTRIRLICTDLTSVGAFTQTGQIATIADTPRTEVGYMHLVISSTAANAVVRCSWISYRHYTATYNNP